MITNKSLYKNIPLNIASKATLEDFLMAYIKYYCIAYAGYEWELGKTFIECIILIVALRVEYPICLYQYSRSNCRICTTNSHTLLYSYFKFKYVKRTLLLLSTLFRNLSSFWYLCRSIKRIKGCIYHPFST